MAMPFQYKLGFRGNGAQSIPHHPCNVTWWFASIHSMVGALFAVASHSTSTVVTVAAAAAAGLAVDGAADVHKVSVRVETANISIGRRMSDS
jgi:hypothetical protein